MRDLASVAALLVSAAAALASGQSDGVAGCCSGGTSECTYEGPHDLCGKPVPGTEGTRDRGGGGGGGGGGGEGSTAGRGFQCLADGLRCNRWVVVRCTDGKAERVQACTGLASWCVEAGDGAFCALDEAPDPACEASSGQDAEVPVCAGPKHLLCRAGYLVHEEECDWRLPACVLLSQGFMCARSAEPSPHCSGDETVCDGDDRWVVCEQGYEVASTSCSAANNVCRTEFASGEPFCVNPAALDDGCVRDGKLCDGDDVLECRGPARLSRRSCANLDAVCEEGRCVPRDE